jgi:hypothetical protein
MTIVLDAVKWWMWDWREETKKGEFGIEELPQVFGSGAVGTALTQTSGSFLLRQRLGEVWSGCEDFQGQTSTMRFRYAAQHEISLGD